MAREISILPWDSGIDQQNLKGIPHNFAKGREWVILLSQVSRSANANALEGLKTSDLGRSDGRLKIAGRAEALKTLRLGKTTGQLDCVDES